MALCQADGDHAWATAHIQQRFGLRKALLNKSELVTTVPHRGALLNKSELVTTVPHRVDCYVMRILFGIPNSVIRLSALTIA
ncbi:hypothetical protein, partial [Symbiopectobacterium sp.]|uniref:hypothetical protein n=1 Tax=Symbiopectobacterium sp. TaxID=2952789 RepID=UPI003F687CD7